MTANDYQRLAMKTLNPKLNRKDMLINGVMGLCGESGEAIDIVKKWLAQGHELDREALAKELGILPGIWRKRPMLWRCCWKKLCGPILKSWRNATRRASPSSVPLSESDADDRYDNYIQTPTCMVLKIIK